MRPELPITLLCGALGLAACSSMPEARSPTVDAPAAIETVQARQIASLMGALMKVVNGTPAEQAEVLAEARQDYEAARLNSPGVLRYGLLLAAPSHPARDPGLAQQMLREAVARREMLSSMEYALAVVELERIGEELRLGSENQRLLTEAQLERERQRNAPSPATLTRQLQIANETNAQLRRELEEARAKLNAIAEYEQRRQAERPPPSEGRNP